jgi:glycine/D-amino acid oxidase-like deaminating enzyme
MIVNRTGKLHPALYLHGLRRAAEAAGASLHSDVTAQTIEGGRGHFELSTSRGKVRAREVIIATNGYTDTLTPWLRRRIIPVASYMIATETLPPDLAASLLPNGRTLTDSRRVLRFARMSPDGSRMLFGGRARFTPQAPQEAAPVLHRFMSEIFPQLKDFRVSHAWCGNVAFTFDFLPHAGEQDGLHYCLGCNGSGVAMMTMLGRKRRERRCLRAPLFPDPTALQRRSAPVPAAGRRRLQAQGLAGPEAGPLKSESRAGAGADWLDRGHWLPASVPAPSCYCASRAALE